MDSQQDSRLASEQGSPKLKLTANQRVQIIKEFFASKGKYPVFSNNLIDEAIGLNFLSYDKKDKILRDPNKLSIFQIELNMNSPRTKEALQLMEVQDDWCHVMSFFDFQSEFEHPIKCLVDYMEYLQGKSRKLLQIVSLRNRLKKISKNNTGNNNVNTNCTITQQASSIFVTDQRNSQVLSKSFNTRSLDFLQQSFDDKLEQITKRNTQYLNTLKKHQQLDEEQNQKLQQYYQATIPSIARKVEKVKELHRLEQNQRKQSQKQRHKKTLEKIEKLEKEDKEHRQQFQEQIKHKFEQSELNRNQLNQSYQQEMQENIERNKKRQEERDAKRQRARELEEQEVEEIIERNQEKTQMAENCLKKIRNIMKLKKIEQQKKIEIANKKVVEKQQEKDQQRLQYFIQIADQSNKMVESQMQLRTKRLNELKLKFEKTKRRFQVSLILKLKKYDHKRNQEDLINENRTLTMLSADRIREIDEREKLRMQRTTRINQEHEQQQEKWLQKIIIEKQKMKKLKSQQEMFKDAIIKQHLELRNTVDKLMK
ncbi:unnamed protein product (macronuclear) [Paramecium tetraurelia]|uniref:LisH domain-containing protein n=1 Tax=Paramecium tetraurelia TaxID=5888 RepID=A0CY75_PARTE|nr:uncharacterized protein GSPATT00039080001 [Paramecium tetraurelia]CAK75742.1 unnamed protein product [Paramecium tetraurelia]|eukprot:XP_001443139.1 hypothetical protein (macronuclear) [Paramecium tetraurelia strain d4-2]